MKSISVETQEWWYMLKFAKVLKIYNTHLFIVN